MSVLPLLLWLVPNVVLPRFTELPNHFADPVELERQTRRLGPSRVFHFLKPLKADAAQVAALRGLSLWAEQAPDVAAQLAVPLTDLLAQTRDDKLRVALYDSLLRMCRALGRFPQCSEADDVDCGGEARLLPARLLRLAEQPTSHPASRNVALSALQTLQPSLWQAAAPRLSALAQSEGEPLRTTALAALSVLKEQENRPELVALVLQPDDTLSAAAAQELCWPLILRKNKSQPGSVLPENIALRVRTAAQGPAPLASRQKTVDCLRAMGTPQDKTLIGQLLNRSVKNRK